MVLTYLGMCVCGFNSWHFHHALHCSKGFCMASHLMKGFNFY